MEVLRRFLASELFLATMPPSIMLVYYIKRENEFNESLHALKQKQTQKQKTEMG